MSTTPTKIFSSRDELIKYAEEIGRSQGYAISIKDSQTDDYVVLVCKRGGAYRNYLGLTAKTRKRKTKTYRCGCPFKLYGKKVTVDQWVLEVKNDEHTHEP